MEADNEIYVGIEAEGRLKGTLTVFAKRPSLHVVEIAKRDGASHVFFGARGHVLEDVDYESLNQLLGGAIPETWIITIQVQLDSLDHIPVWVFQRCHMLLYADVSLPKLLGASDVEIKLEDFGTALVYGNPQIIDLAYVRDREVPNAG